MSVSEFTNKDVEIVGTKPLHQGFFTMTSYRLKHRLFAGGWTPEIEREMMERGHAAALLPYDPKLDQVILVEQFRLGAVPTSDNPWLLELVAGIIEADESPEQVAIRESQEEAGLEILQLQKICSYLPSPGGCTERIHLYVGAVDSCQSGGLYGLPDEHEDIKVHCMSRQQALNLLERGRIDNAATIIGLQWLAMNVQQLRRQWCSEAD